MRFSSHIRLSLPFLLALGCLSGYPGKAQQQAFFDYGIFHIPEQKPFLETYFTFVGNALSSAPKESGYQNSLHITLKISNDTGLVLNKDYNVMGPVYSNSLNAPSFIDIQRYSLKNGTYTLQCEVKDNN